MQNLRGTMGIEGIVISKSTEKNIERIVTGAASYHTILQELNEKYSRAKR